MVACVCGGLFEFIALIVVMLVGSGGAATAGTIYNKCTCKKTQARNN